MEASVHRGYVGTTIDEKVALFDIVDKETLGSEDFQCLRGDLEHHVASDELTIGQLEHVGSLSLVYGMGGISSRVGNPGRGWS